jgi:hypothetical protein
MKTQHTSDPWAYSPHYKTNAEGHLFLNKNGACTITLTGAASMPQEELNEFGKLIAAAPELLASLKDMLRSFETGEHYETRNPYTRPYVQAALAAIAKAEGREE